MEVFVDNLIYITEEGGSGELSFDYNVSEPIPFTSIASNLIFYNLVGYVFNRQAIIRGQIATDKIFTQTPIKSSTTSAEEVLLSYNVDNDELGWIEDDFKIYALATRTTTNWQGFNDAIVLELKKVNNIITLKQKGIVTRGAQYVNGGDGVKYHNGILDTTTTEEQAFNFQFLITLPKSWSRVAQEKHYRALVFEWSPYEQGDTKEMEEYNNMVLLTKKPLPPNTTTELYSEEWQLIDKAFSAMTVDHFFGDKILGDDDLKIHKDIALTSLIIKRTGHLINLSIEFTITKYLNDGGFTNLLEIDLSSLGVLNCGLAQSDETNFKTIFAHSIEDKKALGTLVLTACQKEENPSVLVLNQVDILANGQHYIQADLTSEKFPQTGLFHIDLELPIEFYNMDDDACERFYWARNPDYEEEIAVDENIEDEVEEEEE